MGLRLFRGVYARALLHGRWVWRQGKPDYVADGINCCADDLIALHSYKAESFQDISRWFEYEHFERGYQNVKRKLDTALEELNRVKSLN